MRAARPNTRGIALDPAELARYAELGDEITDDNQLLAYGSTNATTFEGSNQRQQRSIQIIAELSGRYPFRKRAEPDIEFRWR